MSERGGGCPEPSANLEIPQLMEAGSRQAFEVRLRFEEACVCVGVLADAQRQWAARGEQLGLPGVREGGAGGDEGMCV